MGSNILNDIQQLEVLAFFSGYPLIYYLVRILTRNTLHKNSKRAELISILPFAYALIGTLYLGLIDTFDSNDIFHFKPVLSNGGPSTRSIRDFEEQRPVYLITIQINWVSLR